MFSNCTILNTVTSGGAKRSAEAGLSGAASSLSKAKSKVLRPSPPFQKLVSKKMLPLNTRALSFQIIHILITVTSGGAKRLAEARLSGAASSLSKAKSKVLWPSPPSSTSSSALMYDEEVNEGGEGRNTLDLALLKDDAAPLSPASAGLLTPPKICL